MATCLNRVSAKGAAGMEALNRSHGTSVSPAEGQEPHPRAVNVFRAKVKELSSQVTMPLSDKIRKANKDHPSVVWKQRPEVLLCPNIPKPMHGVAPRVVLGSVWWDNERQAAYRSTDYHCIACGIPKLLAEYHQWLEGHELYKINYKKGLMTYVETVPLCHFCHNFIHSGRLEALLEAGQIHHAKYRSIIQHGDRILKQAGLKRLEAYAGPFAEWGRWRLQIGKKKYPPLYKTEESWLEAFTPKDGE